MVGIIGDDVNLITMRLPKLDTLIVAVFFVCIALWMVSRCGSKRSDYLQRAGRTAEQEDRPVRRDTVVVPPPVAQTTPSTVPTTVPATTPATTPTTTPVQQAPAPAPTPAKTPAATPSLTPAKTPATTAPTTAAAAKTAPKTATESKQTTLYVTIDGLKMRQKPGLKSETVAKLDLYEQVYFMGERTDWTQEISLGLEKVTDKWVKVKTKSGKVGWVFGAGVNYYKEKRKGVLE